MRLNGFNEPICTTADEVWGSLDVADFSSGEVYAREVAKDQTDPPGDPERMEVVDDIEGETVCWIEAATFAECRAIALEVGIEVQD